MYPNHGGYVPPPTDGPNTRQREAAGLPLASGTTAPLPSSSFQHSYDQNPGSTMSEHGWPAQDERRLFTHFEASQPVDYYEDYSYLNESTSASAYYPTPTAPPVAAFSDQRIVSTASIIDHGSRPLSPGTSHDVLGLPDFTIGPPTGDAFGLDPGAFPVSASPTGPGFAAHQPLPDDLPPPVQTMTKEEWLRLGGFLDEPAPTPSSSSAGMSRGLSTSTSGSRAKRDRSPASEYMPPPPRPPHGPVVGGGQPPHHYAPPGSYSHSGGRVYVRPSAQPAARGEYQQPQVPPYPVEPSFGMDPMQYHYYNQHPGQMLPPPPPPLQQPHFDWPQDNFDTAGLYGIPSPAASVPSPEQLRRPATAQGSSRRAVARNAPSPVIPARHKPAPYPTSQALAAFQETLTTSPVPVDTPSAHAPTPAPAPSPPAPSSSSSALATPASILPPPTNATRKSHSRKASANHIPRPRNAFILFRSSAVSNNLIPAELGLVDHKNISKVIGEIWRGLGEQERGVWERMAAVEKEEHARRFPGYVYRPKKREVREREKEERKEAAKAARGKQPSVPVAKAEGQPSVLSHVPEGWTSTNPRPLATRSPTVEWDDRRCRAVAMAVLEGQDEDVAAKVEQNIAAEANDDDEEDGEAAEEGGAGSSQDTVVARARVVSQLEQDSNGDILVASTTTPRRSARTAAKATQPPPARAPEVFKLPPLPQPAAAPATGAGPCQSPVRPSLSSVRSSPATITTFPDSLSPTTVASDTPQPPTRVPRRAQSAVEGSPLWPSPSGSSSASSSSPASPGSAQRRHGLHTARYELPTPTRPHPLAQSHSLAISSRLQKQQSFALAGLGISTPGSRPGAFERGASNWDGSVEPSGSFDRLARVSQQQGGLDNSPLLGGGGWGEGGRMASLGRWNLHAAGRQVSRREALAQEAELEGDGEGDAHARQSSGEEQAWPTTSASTAAFDPSVFYSALDDDAQSLAPSWDSSYDALPALGHPSSQHPSSSASSQYQHSSSSRMAPQSAGDAKTGVARAPSFHVHGQELFSAPVADASALFGEPQDGAF